MFLVPLIHLSAEFYRAGATAEANLNGIWIASNVPGIEHIAGSNLAEGLVMPPPGWHGRVCQSESARSLSRIRFRMEGAALSAGFATYRRLGRRFLPFQCFAKLLPLSPLGR
jgi:hypothetical protein